MHRYNKYHATKVMLDGLKFDSKKEAQRYKELTLMEKQGIIHGLERQVKFVLIPSQRLNGRVIERECAYIADFVYLDADDNKVVEDCKGMRTEVYKIKRKLMLYVHSIRIKEV